MATPLVIQRKSDLRYISNFELGPSTPGNGPRPFLVEWCLELAEAFIFDAGDPTNLMAASAIERLLLPQEVEIIAHPNPALLHASMQRRFQAELETSRAIAVDALKYLQGKFTELRIGANEGVMVAAMISAAIINELARDKTPRDLESIRNSYTRTLDAYINTLSNQG